MLSVLDIFRVGIGPSSSHTVGPMRIALRFLRRLERRNILDNTASITVFFRGSLAFTGEGHGTFRAAQLGLLGFEPETIDLKKAEADLASLQHNKRFRYKGRDIAFDPEDGLVVDYENPAQLHPNEMELRAFNETGECRL